MYNIFRTATGRFMYAAQGSEFDVLAPITEVASNIDFAQKRCDELNNPNREIPIDVKSAHQMYQLAVDAGEPYIIGEKLQSLKDICDKYKLPYNCMDKKQ